MPDTYPCQPVRGGQEEASRPGLAGDQPLKSQTFVLSSSVALQVRPLQHGCWSSHGCVTFWHACSCCAQSLPCPSSMLLTRPKSKSPGGDVGALLTPAAASLGRLERGAALAAVPSNRAMARPDTVQRIIIPVLSLWLLFRDIAYVGSVDTWNSATRPSLGQLKMQIERPGPWFHPPRWSSSPS